MSPVVRQKLDLSSSPLVGIISSGISMLSTKLSELNEQVLAIETNFTLMWVVLLSATLVIV